MQLISIHGTVMNHTCYGKKKINDQMKIKCVCAKHKNTYWSVFSLKQNPNKGEVNADALIKHKLGVREDSWER